jgi:hypothetical protein
VPSSASSSDFLLDRVEHCFHQVIQILGVDGLRLDIRATEISIPVDLLVKLIIVERVPDREGVIAVQMISQR